MSVSGLGSMGRTPRDVAAYAARRLIARNGSGPALVAHPPARRRTTIEVSAMSPDPVMCAASRLATVSATTLTNLR